MGILELLFPILTMMAWTVPLAAELGAADVSRAWRVSLPITLALHFGARRRYPHDAEGLGVFRRDPFMVAAAGAVAQASAVLVLLDVRNGLPFVFALTWLSGSALVQRGWWLAFGAILAISGLAVVGGVPPAVVLVGTLLALAICVTAATLTAPASPRRPVPWSQVTKAALIGCLGGLLLVSQPELAARMSGVAALAVLPALGAGLWASRHASGLWQRLPEAMTHVDICRRAVAPLRRCVGVLLLGALARLVGGTLALSIAFFYLVPTLDPSAANLTVPLMEVGTFGLVMFVAGLLDAFRRTWSAVLVIAVSLFTIHALDAAAAAGFPATVGGFLPVLAGGAASLAVGVSVLLAVFREPDRAFATTM